MRVMNLARKLGNVAQTCRSVGVSRTRYYEWKSLGQNYGLEALMPEQPTGHAPSMSETGLKVFASFQTAG
jgi:hypothetical protein